MKSFQKQLVEFGFRDKKVVGENFGVLKRFWYAYSSFGQIFERASKIAMMSHLDARAELSEAEIKRFVREQGGSPDFNERINREAISIAELCFAKLFINPMIQGVRAERSLLEYSAQMAKNKAEILKAAKEKGGKLSDQELHKIGMKGVARYLAWLAAFGCFGGAMYAYARLGKPFMANDDDSIRMWRKIPKWDRLNRVCIPLAEDSNGKTVYLRLPYGDFEKYIGGLFTSLAESIGETETFGDALSEIFDSVKNVPASEFGGSHPITSSLYALGDYYVLGNNPRDWRGAEILDNAEFRAGDTLKNAEAMGKFVYNQTVGSVIGRIPAEPRDGVAAPSGIEAFLNLPIMKPIFGRYIAVSDAGIREIAQRASAKVARDEAMRTIEKRDIVSGALKLSPGEQTDYIMRRLNRLPNGATRQDLTYIKGRYEAAAARGSTVESAISDATTKRQKDAIKREFERLKLMDN